MPKRRVSIKVIVDLVFQRGHFIVERVEQMLDRRADDRTVGCRLEAIPLLLSHALEGIEPADQRLQLAQLPRRRGPRGRLLGATELGDEPRVGWIGFGA